MAGTQTTSSEVGDTSLPWLEFVDGGAGDDTMTLSGTSYSSATVVSKVTGIETIVLAGGFNYNFEPDDVTVAAGANLNVDASALGSGNSLTWDGNREIDGVFTITGGDNDIITGGYGRDVIRTGGGSTSLAYGGEATTSSNPEPATTRSNSTTR